MVDSFYCSRPLRFSRVNEPDSAINLHLAPDIPQPHATVMRVRNVPTINFLQFHALLMCRNREEAYFESAKNL